MGAVKVAVPMLLQSRILKLGISRWRNLFSLICFVLLKKKSKN